MRAAHCLLIMWGMSLVGCAQHAPLTRAEWLAQATHNYSGVTQEQAIAAAERVLRLADGEDFQIVHKADGFDATRNWSWYALLVAESGTDTWEVRTNSNNGGVTISVYVGTFASDVQPIPTTDGSWTAGSTGGRGNTVSGTAIYDLFWARMDYLLGTREEWMDCLAAEHRLKRKVIWGQNNALCNAFNVKDERPTSRIIPFAKPTEGSK